MPNSNTKIQLKRSVKSFTELANEPITYGEPIFIELDDTSFKNKILVIGNLGDNTLQGGTFFEGIINKDLVGKTVYANSDNIAITQNNESVATNKVVPIPIETPSQSDTRYYLLSSGDTQSQTGESIYVHKFNKNSAPCGIYISGTGVLHGGAWNDYAEQRVCINGKPGQVVCETGLGVLDLSSFKLQPLPYVISDTYGMVIGDEQEYSQPVALNGRVLVYVNDSVTVGDVVCAGENGFASKMTRQEIINYPDRILGIVSELPTYDTWNDISVDGRVWITIK